MSSYTLREVPIYVAVLHRQYQNDMNKAFKKYDVNVTSAYFLIYLANNKNVSQMEISNNLVLDKARVARLVSDLEKKGLLTKNVSDKKKNSNILKITDSGLSLVPKLEEIRERWWLDKMERASVEPDSPILPGLKELYDIIIKLNKEDSEK